MEAPFQTASLPVATGLGVFIAHYTHAGLAGLSWPRGNRSGSKPGISPKLRAWHRLTARALNNVLAGKPAGALPPLDWAGGTEFQKSVWRELLKIPRGDTVSYGDVARAIGSPKAVRAVGAACGANPIPVLVPCHRVLAANRRLGGYTGGLERKKRLLTLEKALFEPSESGRG